MNASCPKGFNVAGFMASRTDWRASSSGLESSPEESVECIDSDEWIKSGRESSLWRLVSMRMVRPGAERGEGCALASSSMLSICAT